MLAVGPLDPKDRLAARLEKFAVPLERDPEPDLEQHRAVGELREEHLDRARGVPVRHAFDRLAGDPFHEVEVVAVGDADREVDAPLARGVVHEDVLKHLAVGDDHELALRVGQVGGPQVDGADRPEMTVGRDHVAGVHRVAQGEVDAREDILPEILEGEREGEPGDAGAGEEGGDRLVEPEDAEGHDHAGPERHHVEEERGEPGDLDAADQALEERKRGAAGDPGEDPEGDQHEGRDHEVGEKQRGLFDPALQLFPEQGENLPDLRRHALNPSDRDRRCNRSSWKRGRKGHGVHGDGRGDSRSDASERSVPRAPAHLPGETRNRPKARRRSVDSVFPPSPP